MTWLEVLGSFVGGGALVAIITAIANRRKVEADADKTCTEAENQKLKAQAEVYSSLAGTVSILHETAANNLEEYSKRIAKQDEKIGHLEGKIDSLQNTLLSKTNEMAAYIEENVKLKSELESVRRALTARDKDVESLKKALNDAKKRIDELESQMGVSHYDRY